MVALSFLVEPGHVRTDGLASIGRPEIVVKLGRGRSVEWAESLLRDVAGYVVSAALRPRDGDILVNEGTAYRLTAREDGALILRKATPKDLEI